MEPGPAATLPVLRSDLVHQDLHGWSRKPGQLRFLRNLWTGDLDRDVGPNACRLAVARTSQTGRKAPWGHPHHSLGCRIGFWHRLGSSWSTHHSTCASADRTSISLSFPSPRYPLTINPFYPCPTHLQETIIKCYIILLISLAQ